MTTKRLQLDFPKISDWAILRFTVMVLFAMTIYSVCILPFIVLIIGLIITALFGPVFS